MLDGAEGFEDGTINYLNLPAVQIGLNHLEDVGRDLIHQRVACLTGWLLDELGSLRHPKGTPAILIYGPRNCRDRGGTILCNFLAPDGALIDYRPVETRANARRISLRTGCFCRRRRDRPSDNDVGVGPRTGRRHFRSRCRNSWKLSIE